MKLISLMLQNFKGIRNFELDAQGQDIDVFGDNATGKTTLSDAFQWLLFGKDSQGKVDFEIKTLDENNKAYPGLEHSVEAEFLMDDGQRLTLCKVFKEKWVKKRGSAQAVFSGHTTDHFVNGVPVPQRDYNMKITEVVRDEEAFRLLTNPLYFNTMLHWEKRRRILLEVCGDISDTEVIASDKALAKLPEIIPAGRMLDEHKKVIAARRAEINKELERIPVRIDEATRALPDLTGIQTDRIPLELANLKHRKQQKEHERARIESGGEIADRKRQLAEVEAELISIKNEHATANDQVVNEKRRLLHDARERFVAIELEIKTSERRALDIDEDIKALNTKIDKLREDWHTENKKTFEYSIASVCPTCGQNLPEEQLAQAREEAQSNFNKSKSETLEAINKHGKELKSRVDTLTSEQKDLDEKIYTLKGQLNKTANEITALKADIEKLQNQSTPITENKAYQQKLQSKANIEKIIAGLQRGNREAIERVNRDIADLSIAIASMEADAAKIQRHKDGQKRIEELKKQERALAAEYEKLEGELYLCEQFVRAKVKLLEEKINNRFSLARFKLFDVQVNGGLVECCETLYRGVPYPSMNNAARINVGLDIIRTLSEHYGFAAPVFIDNAEAVTELVDPGGQVIRLIVSKDDKKLRVEYPARKEKRLFEEAV